jgi:hypothetical protein
MLGFNILLKSPSKCLALETGFETVSKSYQKTPEHYYAAVVYWYMTH